MEKITFYVRSGDGAVREDGTWNDAIDLITRSVRQHSGWQSVIYKGKRYVLNGGIHNFYFINLKNPIKEKNTQKES